MLGSGIPISTIIVKNLIPVTIGNIIGGGFFVGGFYSAAYGQLYDVAWERTKAAAARVRTCRRRGGWLLLLLSSCTMGCLSNCTMGGAAWAGRLFPLLFNKPTNQHTDATGLVGLPGDVAHMCGVVLVKGELVFGPLHISCVATPNRPAVLTRHTHHRPNRLCARCRHSQRRRRGAVLGGSFGRQAGRRRAAWAECRQLDEAGRTGPRAQQQHQQRARPGVAVIVAQRFRACVLTEKCGSVRTRRFCQRAGRRGNRGVRYVRQQKKNGDAHELDVVLGFLLGRGLRFDLFSGVLL